MSTDSVPQQQGTGRQATMWITLTGVCAVLVLIGSFLPWAHVSDLTINGIEGDGRITLVLAVLAIVFALWGSGRIGIGGKSAIPLSLLVACMALIALTGIVDFNNVQRLDVGGLGQLLAIGVSAGLVLVLIFGVVGLTTSIVALVQGVRRR